MIWVGGEVNTKKTLVNSIISVLAQVGMLLMQFINRRVFVIFLDIEFLGYQSLFGNVFTLLSVAELGIGNAISYQLYKEVVARNEKEINKLMGIYRFLYRIIAIVVLLLGILFSFALPYIIKDSTQKWSFLYTIYFLQLSGMVSGYFFSYKRILYTVCQQEYKCAKVDLHTSFLMQLLQLGLLAVFKNYLLYLCIQLATTFVSNVVIAYKADHDYPYLKAKYSVSLVEIREKHILTDVKNLLAQKISYAIFGGTDNIVISALCGINQVALYGNYFSLQKGVMQVLFSRLLNPIQATIGNIVYSDRKKESLWEQFEILDIFSLYFANYVGMGFLIFFQFAIQIWMGAEYLLPMSFVVSYAIYIYFGALWEIVYKYRSVFGEFDRDRNYYIVSAILNIVISVLCAKIWGVTGVQVGTVISTVVLMIGRVKFVVGYFFEHSWIRYFAKHMALFAVTVVEGAGVLFLTNDISINIAGFLIRGIVWIAAPMITCTAVSFRNKNFSAFLGYISNVKNIVLHSMR